MVLVGLWQGWFTEHAQKHVGLSSTADLHGQQKDSRSVRRSHLRLSDLGTRQKNERKNRY